MHPRDGAGPCRGRRRREAARPRLRHCAGRVADRPAERDHGRVRKTIDSATAGPVAEGNVGAGTGTQAFGWKGGIGSSSRLLPKALGGYTVGVLVQTNYGGVLSVDGAPVGKRLGQYLLKEAEDQYAADGSIVVVIATGSPMSNGSGEYAMAFSTAASVRRTPERRSAAGQFEELPNDKMTPLFQAAMEATQEAIYNAMVVATTMSGSEGHTLHALPLDKLKAILAEHGIRKDR